MLELFFDPTKSLNHTSKCAPSKTSKTHQFSFPYAAYSILHTPLLATMLIEAVNLTCLHQQSLVGAVVSTLATPGSAGDPGSIPGRGRPNFFGLFSDPSSSQNLQKLPDRHFDMWFWCVICWCDTFRSQCVFGGFSCGCVWEFSKNRLIRILICNSDV